MHSVVCLPACWPVQLYLLALTRSSLQIDNQLQKQSRIVPQLSPLGHPEVVQSDKHLLLSHYSDGQSQSCTKHSTYAFVNRAVSFAIGLSRGCIAQDGGGQGLWNQHRSLQLSQNIVKMSVHQDSRMYEAKYPEVDDVVMVQVRGCSCCSCNRLQQLAMHLRDLMLQHKNKYYVTQMPALGDLSACRKPKSSRRASHCAAHSHLLCCCHCCNA